MSKLKRYAHPNDHIMKAFRCEQTSKAKMILQLNVVMTLENLEKETNGVYLEI